MISSSGPVLARNHDATQKSDRPLVKSRCPAGRRKMKGKRERECVCEREREREPKKKQWLIPSSRLLVSFGQQNKASTKSIVAVMAAGLEHASDDDDRIFADSLGENVFLKCSFYFPSMNFWTELVKYFLALITTFIDSIEVNVKLLPCEVHCKLWDMWIYRDPIPSSLALGSCSVNSWTWMFTWHSTTEYYVQR